MIKLFLPIWGKRIKSFFKRESNFKIAVYFFTIIIFFIGIFLFFLKLFSFLNKVELIGPVISGKILSYSFFIFLFLLLISNSITALSTFFKSREVEFLMSLPVEPSDIFSIELISTTFYSSWATLIGAIPITLAYILVFSRSFLSILFLIPFFLFLIIPSFTGVLLLLLLKRFNPQLTVKQLGITLGILVIILIGLYIKTNPYSFNFPDFKSLEAVNKFVDGFRLTNPYFPNEWFFNSLQGLINRQFWIFSKYSLLLLLGSVLLTISLYFAVISWYRSLWLLSETGKRKTKIKASLLLKQPTQCYNIISKDTKIFFRNPQQWVQFLIIISLLVFYVISLRRTPLFVHDPFWLTIIALVNTGFVGYISATLSLRFVFPSISLEGSKWWILRSSPLSPNLILTSKIVLFALFNSIVSIFVVGLSNMRLTGDPIITFISIIIAICFSITTVILSASLGTIFADFNEQNPAKIASSAGGLISAIASLMYIAISLFIFFHPLSLYIQSFLQGKQIDVLYILSLPMLTFLIFTVATAIIPFRIAIRKVRIIET